MTTGIKGKLDSILAKRAKLDSELETAQQQAAREEYSDLMRQRVELLAARDAEMGRLFGTKQDLMAKAQQARAVADAAASEARMAGIVYLQAGPRWDNKIAELDSKIRATRPPELDAFLTWISEYASALHGSYTWGSPFMNQQAALVPLVEVKDAYGAPKAVVDRDRLSATRELLRDAEQKALSLGVEVEPTAFLTELAKLRAETEKQLTRLRS